MISDANCSVVEQKQENNWPVAGGLLGGRFIRWDEKAGLRGMRYAPSNRRARGARERRPAVKKISTVATNRNEIFKEPKLTIGLDLGDRSSHYCILDEAGEGILVTNVMSNTEGVAQEVC